MPVRYVSSDEDSARWEGFEFREGDIVISTRSKHGTTWMQMITALLVFGSPDLPAPLHALSPWLDHLIEPIDVVLDRLDAQRHRRFIKTHTPLDGIPSDERASYIVVARDPLDAAVSLYHQGTNIDRKRLAALTGSETSTSTERPQLGDWLRSWIATEADPAERLDSLPGVVHHLGDAWARANRDDNVILVRYADLQADLAGSMRGLAYRLGIEVDAATWPNLVDAASFASMRDRAAELAPNPLGVLRDSDAFFRRGGRGEGAGLLDDGDIDRYHQRLADLADPEMLAWLTAPATGRSLRG